MRQGYGCSEAAFALCTCKTVSLGFASYNLLGRVIVTGHPHDAKVGERQTTAQPEYLMGFPPDLPFTGRMLFLRHSEPRRALEAGFKASNTSKNGLLGSMEI